MVRLKNFVPGLLLILSIQVAAASELPLYRPASFDEVTSKVLLEEGWRVYRGDLKTPPTNADTLKDWQNVESDGPFRQVIYDGSGEPFWYVNRFLLSDHLKNSALYMAVDQIGSMVVYWNGVQVHRAHAGDDETLDDGWVYSIADVLDPVPGIPDTVTIAIRYWNERPQGRRLLMMTSPGFRISLLRGEQARHQFYKNRNNEVRLMSLLVGFSLAFAILHLLIFFFFPKSHAHLHFTAFTASVTMLMWMIGLSRTTMNFSEYLFLEYGFKLALVLISLTGLRFMQTVQGLQHYRGDLITLALMPLGAFLVWKGTMVATYMLVLLALVGWAASLVIAHVKRIRGSWILAVGFGAFGITGIQQALYAMGILIPKEGSGEELILLIGLVVLLVSMSLYLARSFAETNRELEARIDEVRSLSDRTLEQERIAREQEMERLHLTEENRRREVELEEAKKRQAVLEELEEAYTQLRQTQSQLIQTEKMASLGRLVAGIAHEINTPVGAVNSMKDTLQRAFGKMKELLTSEEFAESDLRPKAERLIGVIDEAIKVIGSGTDRVSEIVRRLRSFARLDEAELKNIDLNAAMEDTISLVRHELGGRIEVVREFGDVGQVPCFPARLNQVVLNLLMNSVQAIQGEGKITLRTIRSDRQVIIEVEDTGQGIPENRLQKIFDPGFTTKGVGVGTGLGLAITYRIIQEHRGRIHVESEIGKGTRFRVILPVNLPDLLEQTPVSKEEKDGNSFFTSSGQRRGSST